MLARTMSHGFDPADRDAVYHAIFSRRDVRSHFSDAPLDDAVLARLINAAHHAPSVGYMQPWNFIVIRDRHKRAQVRDLFVAARQAEVEQIAADRQDLYRRLRLEGICESAVNLCITCDRSRSADSPLGRWHNPDMDRFSTVCAVQNLWLAARAEGIGVGWVSILDKTALKHLLGIPEHVEPIAYLCLGCTIFAFLGQLWATKHTSASRAGMLLGTEPGWALLAGVLLASDPVGALGYAGAAVLLGATWWGARAEQRWRGSGPTAKEGLAPVVAQADGN